MKRPEGDSVELSQSEENQAAGVNKSGDKQVKQENKNLAEERGPCTPLIFLSMVFLVN